ncbi:hypothetical protein MNBD_GAMMA10-1816 [hydrothermal vent metagenome]|uniref:Uncharacterized protein n=1 Tax=hydrothermal vent metagenome TaxID=652676 RepID=A0A3B0Y8A8_9ZZZZ
MRDAMIDMMVMMMPYMKPFMWFAAVVAALGLVFIIVKIAFKKEIPKTLAWTRLIVFISAGFFFGAQLAGYFLNMPPTVNFGDSSKFEFILVSFWQIGAAFLFAGLVLKFLGGSEQTAEA